jgi:hypothetical protein
MNVMWTLDVEPRGRDAARDVHERDEWAYFVELDAPGEDPSSALAIEVTLGDALATVELYLERARRTMFLPGLGRGHPLVRGTARQGHLSWRLDVDEGRSWYLRVRPVLDEAGYAASLEPA